MSRLRTYLRKLRQVMVKDPLPPEAVAKGWALGMFVGCAVPFGLQLLVSVPIALAMKVSKIGATVGTLVTNPVTIFFIYPVQIWVGSRLIGMPLDWSYIDGATQRISKVSLLHAEGWQMLSELSGRVLGGFFAGGLLMALILTPITYILVKHTVLRFRKSCLKRSRITNPCR